MTVIVGQPINCIYMKKIMEKNVYTNVDQLVSSICFQLFFKLKGKLDFLWQYFTVFISQLDVIAKSIYIDLLFSFMFIVLVPVADNFNFKNALRGR